MPLPSSTAARTSLPRHLQEELNTGVRTGRNAHRIQEAEEEHWITRPAGGVHNALQRHKSNNNKLLQVRFKTLDPVESTKTVTVAVAA